MSHEMDLHPLPALHVAADLFPSTGRCIVHTLGLVVFYLATLGVYYETRPFPHLLGCLYEQCTRGEPCVSVRQVLRHASAL